MDYSKLRVQANSIRFPITDDNTGQTVGQILGGVMYDSLGKHYVQLPHRRTGTVELEVFVTKNTGNWSKRKSRYWGCELAKDSVPQDAFLLFRLK